MCERLAVGPNTRQQYNILFMIFKSWAAIHYPHVDLLLDSPSQIEIVVLAYLDVLLQQRRPAGDAEKAVASICDGLPAVLAPHSMPRVARALRGYRKRFPHVGRYPFLEALMAAVVAWMVHHRHLDAAWQIFIMFITYLRPGEVRQLHVADLVKPCTKGMAKVTDPLKFFALVVAPQARRVLSKTETFDDTVVLDLPEWAGPALLSWTRGSKPTGAMSKTPDDEMVLLWKQALASLGIPSAVMYQLRHGGASNDFCKKTRRLDEIMARGRWRTQTSLRRYVRSGQVQFMLGAARADTVRYGEKMLPRLESLLRGSLRGPPLP